LGTKAQGLVFIFLRVAEELHQRHEGKRDLCLKFLRTQKLNI